MVHAPAGEVHRGDMRKRIPHVKVSPHRFEVRTITRPSRPDEPSTAKAVKVHGAKAVAPSIPGMEDVTRTQRQPANRSESTAESASETSATESEERHITG